MSNNQSPVPGRAARAFPAVATFALLGLIGWQVHSCAQNSLSLTFNDRSNADRCLSDVINNKGLLREPLPVWNVQEGSTKASTAYYFGNLAQQASYLSDDVIARCEEITGQTRSPEWDKLLQHRPQ